MVEGTKLETHHDLQNAVFGIIRTIPSNFYRVTFRQWVNATGDASNIMGNTFEKL
jgi:hypothetical protein